MLRCFLSSFFLLLAIGDHFQLVNGDGEDIYRYTVVTIAQNGPGNFPMSKMVMKKPKFREIVTKLFGELQNGAHPRQVKRIDMKLPLFESNLNCFASMDLPQLDDLPTFFKSAKTRPYKGLRSFNFEIRTSEEGPFETGGFGYFFLNQQKFLRFHHNKTLVYLCFGHEFPRDSHFIAEKLLEKSADDDDNGEIGLNRVVFLILLIILPLVTLVVGFLMGYFARRRWCMTRSLASPPVSALRSTRKAGFFNQNEVTMRHNDSHIETGNSSSFFLSPTTAEIEANRGGVFILKPGTSRMDTFDNEPRIAPRKASPLKKDNVNAVYLPFSPPPTYQDQVSPQINYN